MKNKYFLFLIIILLSGCTLKYSYEEPNGNDIAYLLSPSSVAEFGSTIELIKISQKTNKNGCSFPLTAINKNIGVNKNGLRKVKLEANKNVFLSVSFVRIGSGCGQVFTFLPKSDQTYLLEVSPVAQNEDGSLDRGKCMISLNQIIDDKKTIVDYEVLHTTPLSDLYCPKN